MMNGLAWFGLGLVIGAIVVRAVERTVPDELDIEEVWIEGPRVLVESPTFPVSQGQAEMFWRSVGRC